MNTTATTDRIQRSLDPSREIPVRPTALARAVARLATWRVWTVSGAVYVVFALVLFTSSAPFAIPRVEALCGQPPLDVRVTSGAAEVNGFLTACGTAGREAYRALQLADVVYPLCFAVFLASSLALVLSRLAPTHPRLLVLVALPFLASAFDYIENALAWRALIAFPRASSTDGLLGVASTAKAATSWIAGGLLIVCLTALGLAVARRSTARLGHPDTDSRDRVER
jgi:hypothetical protein